MMLRVPVWHWLSELRLRLARVAVALLRRRDMANVFDVAKFILEQHGKMTTMKLQKLVYYSQAWSLAWSGVAIFGDKIRGWREGPVVGSLHNEHRGWRTIEGSNLRQGDVGNLSGWQREAIVSVVAYYGRFSPEELSELTHQEEPWLLARRGLSKEDKGSEEISHGTMRDFYAARAGTRDAPSSPQLLSHLDRGIDDARAGRVVSVGSFAEYLED